MKKKLPLGTRATIKETRGLPLLGFDIGDTVQVVGYEDHELAQCNLEVAKVESNGLPSSYIIGFCDVEHLDVV